MRDHPIFKKYNREMLTFRGSCAEGASYVPYKCVNTSLCLVVILIWLSDGANSCCLVRISPDPCHCRTRANDPFEDQQDI